MTDRLRTAFRDQAQACEYLGSPFMARLCTLLGDRLEPTCALTRRLFDWPGDLSASGHSVPLRLAGALHSLVLRGDAGLRAVYPPQDVDDDALWCAVAHAIQQHAADLGATLDSAPQTNEVRRSAALIAVGHSLAAHYKLPFVFSELGASAGLNLNWDRYALALPTATIGPHAPILTLTPNWTGPTPPNAPVQVAQRAGVDLNPLDAADPAHRLRLMSYLWPDQVHRQTLTAAAIAATPPRPDKADAIDWLEPRLAPHPGQVHFIWTTIAWQYFPKESQDRGCALIEAAGAKATPKAPLAWFSYESDGQKPGAALTLRLWPEDLTLDLGRADFHGRWVDWRGVPPLSLAVNPV
ncbi:DUF2332 domain-containing protein [Pararhodobacter sp.]|uniref:DUF2332 domain-containing protein n=1 Tax=Pararhodobacter sp. TaxID=2127056 RepID=UPI002AFE2253|nr:DUF2332 family protein [Pararhodobacter sp.]